MSTVVPSVVLLLGGDAVTDPGALAALGELPAETMVVAADSGLHVAAATGLAVHHVVGDRDSADPVLLEAAVAAGAVEHLHPADKDATDSELGLDLARRLLGDRGPGLEHRSSHPHLLVVGGGGGRLDHLLVDLLALAGPRLEQLEVTAHLDAAVVTVVRAGRPRTVAGPPGDLVSLLAVHGPARGVTTTGLRWPLVDADLAPGSSRGVSNELRAAEATVAVGRGTLVVVQPGARAAAIGPRPGPYDPSPVEPA